MKLPYFAKAWRDPKNIEYSRIIVLFIFFLSICLLKIKKWSRQTVIITFWKRVPSSEQSRDRRCDFLGHEDLRRKEHRMDEESEEGKRIEGLRRRNNSTYD